MRIRSVPIPSLVFVAALGASAIAAQPELHPTASTVDLTTIGVAARASLPGATIVRFGSRRVSIATLLAEHRSRLQRFANAKALGSANPISTTPIGNRMFLFHPPAGTLAAPKQIDIANIQPQTIFDANRYQGSNADVWHVGYDYIDYCVAAKATICLYLPSGSPLFLFRATSGKYYAEDIDPFIDSTGCTNLNGYYSPTGSNPGCELFYPASDDRHFTPGPANQTYVTGTCDASDGFTGLNDSHGYVRAVFSKLTTDYTPQNTLTLDNVTTCVIRVATPPGTNP